MRRIDENCSNLFTSTYNTFCKNIICKKYEDCTRYISNYEFTTEENRNLSIFIFAKGKYYQDIKKCNNFIEKEYKNIKEEKKEKKEKKNNKENKKEKSNNGKSTNK